MLLGRAGGALDGQRRVAADRRRQVLGEPALARPRLADEQQGPLRRQGDDRPLDDAVVAEELAGDRHLGGLPSIVALSVLPPVT